MRRTVGTVWRYHDALFIEMQVAILLTLIQLLAGEGVETCLDINNRRHRTMHDRTMMLEFAAVSGHFQRTLLLNLLIDRFAFIRRCAH